MAESFKKQVEKSLDDRTYANTYRLELDDKRKQAIKLLESDNSTRRKTLGKHQNEIEGTTNIHREQYLRKESSAIEAHIQLQKQQIEILTRTSTALDDLKVADCLNEWLRHVEEENDIEPSTLNGYKGPMRYHLIPDLGDLLLDDFCDDDWRRYRRYKKDPLKFKFGEEQSQKPKRLVRQAEQRIKESRKQKRRAAYIHLKANCLELTDEAKTFFERFNISYFPVFKESGEDSYGRKKNLVEKLGYSQTYDYSDRMIKMLKLILNMSFNRAVIQGRIPTNPISRSKSKAAKTKNARKRNDLDYWEPPQLKLFFAALNSKKWEGGYHQDGMHWLAGMFNVAAKTGMRRSEICGLLWDNVDFSSGELSVKTALTFGDYSDVRLTSTKSDNSERVLKVDSKVLAFLEDSYLKQLESYSLSSDFEQWIAAQEQERIPKDSSKPVFVFCNPRTHSWIHPQTVTRVFSSTVDTLIESGVDIPYASFHGLRHSHASLLINCDQNPKRIQQRMGHSSIQVTYDVYGHLFKDSDQDLADLVAEELDF